MLKTSSLEYPTLNVLRTVPEHQPQCSEVCLRVHHTALILYNHAQILIFNNFSGKQNMHPIIAKTFGGLSLNYYARNFIFGLIFPAFFLFMQSQTTHPTSIGTIVFLVLSTLLYPYARFVYESIVGYIMGQNVFFINAIVMLIVKLITMLLCWTCAIFIAPLGLVYLYFYHSKQQTLSKIED